VSSFIVDSGGTYRISPETEIGGRDKVNGGRDPPMAEYRRGLLAMQTFVRTATKVLFGFYPVISYR
jgi:hypothetical protein